MEVGENKQNAYKYDKLYHFVNTDKTKEFRSNYNRQVVSVSINVRSQTLMEADDEPL